MFEEPVGLSAEFTTPPITPPTAPPAVSSSSGLEQHQLAEELEERLTGILEVSETVRGLGGVSHATVSYAQHATHPAYTRSIY